MGDALNLRVIREPSTNAATIGSLWIDGVWQCWTLEDIVRPPGVKVPGETAIPAGRYPVRLTPSARFGRTLPEILEVPNFRGIRIHAGNRSSDTAGCLLVGAERGGVWIAQSRIAFEKVMAKLVMADSITLRIYNAEDV